MTDNENKYWAFLSYSPQDNCEQRSDTPTASHLCWGDWLPAALKTFSIPAEFIGQINGRGEIIPERIDPIFQDESGLSEDATLSAASRQALERSICLVVICSPRSAKNLQVNEAVRYFKQLGRGQHILPLVIAGEPNASEGTRSGVSPDDECLVPALRHPVLPDGTLDTTRLAAKYLFVDARYGVEKREILAHDQRSAEADLEMAKIQLIALLIGVGFNGLWWREQKRHFFDLAAAQHQAQEALHQVAEVQRQLSAAQQQTRDAQHEALASQNLPRDVQDQIQTAQTQAQAAQNEAREAAQQLQEFQTKVRDTQTQLEEARHRALAAESKVLEAQSQSREIQNQLEATRQQAREAQDKILQIQNLAPEVSGQLQDAQNQILKAQNEAQNLQSQFAETRQQAQATENKLLAAQSQVQEFQNQVRATESQLVEAREHVRAAQDQIVSAQQQAREAQEKILELQNQERAAQSQVEETRKDLRAVENKFLEAQSQARVAQTQVQVGQTQSQAARRLTRVLAVLAVLGLLAAGLTARNALRQRQLASQALTKAAAEASGTFALTPGGFDQAQIRQVLLNIGGAEQAENRLHSLDALAARIPLANFPETLQASALMVDDRQRRHFQEALLDYWTKTNLPAAFDWTCQWTDTEARQRALEKMIPAVASDNLTNTFTRLNELPPAPDTRVYQLLFQRWAAHDPLAALAQRSQLPNHDSDNEILNAILTVWVAQQPAAAVAWVKAQPDSAAKTKALETCVRELAKSDAPQAIAMAESLPAGIWQRAVLASIAGPTTSAAAGPELNQLDWLPGTLAPWLWPTLLWNTNGVSPAVAPVETELLSHPTNSPVEIPPKE